MWIKSFWPSSNAWRFYTEFIVSIENGCDKIYICIFFFFLYYRTTTNKHSISDNRQMNVFFTAYRPMYFAGFTAEKTRTRLRTYEPIGIKYILILIQSQLTKRLIFDTFVYQLPVFSVHVPIF